MRWLIQIPKKPCQKGLFSNELIIRDFLLLLGWGKQKIGIVFSVYNSYD